MSIFDQKNMGMSLKSSLSDSAIWVTVLLVILLGTPLMSKGQHTVTVQSGYAQPTGDLSDLGLPTTSTYTEPTVGFNAEYTFQVNDLLVVQASGSYQDFSVNKAQLRRFYGNNFRFTDEPESNKLTTFMAGPAMQLTELTGGPIRARLGVQAGYMRLALMSYSGSDESGTITYGPKTASTLGYKAGIDLTYQFNSWLGITLSSNVVHGRFETGVPFQFSNSGILERISGPNNVSAVQIMLGLSASFQ